MARKWPACCALSFTLVSVVGLRYSSEPSPFPRLEIMSVYSPEKEELKASASCVGTVGQWDQCVGLHQSTDSGDQGHQKWKQNLLKYAFCHWLSFVSMDCCRCGRGALSATLMLLSVLGPDERISGLSLFVVHCQGAFLGVAGGGCGREGS